jgi:hypothetical protein
MDLHTIPDSFAGDLKAFFLANPPVAIDEKRVRLQHETEDLPSPRLMILCGNPARIPKMDGTARVPVSLEIVTSMDRAALETHRSLAGALQSWWIALRAQKLSESAFARCYMHDFLVIPPSTVERARGDDREQVTTLRAEALVTLFAEPTLI